MSWFTEWQSKRDTAQKQSRVRQIDQRLKAIDVETMRPLRAQQAGTATQADTYRINDLESEAEALRSERVTLVAEIGAPDTWTE